jgi:hypothetical protein
MRKKPPVILKEIREKKLPEIDYATQKSISYSQMSMFNECPKKWSLQYREGHKSFTSSIHTVFGTALHETLQHYLTVMYEQSGAAADRLNTSEMLEENLREEYKKQYKANNNQHFVTPDELREFYEDGVEIIREFSKDKTKYFGKRGWHLVGCEVPIILTPHSKYQNVMQIKDIWGWLNEITLYKTPIENISEESWEKWNSYMIHRYVSMNINYVELANFVQTLPYENKQQTYTIYREMIPKTKTFLKYVKSRTKRQPATLVEYVAKHFECSLGEAEEYIDLLREHGVRQVLYSMGIEDKEVTKLLKK